jgi:uncharacterized iron-regulated membrane protein
MNKWFYRLHGWLGLNFGLALFVVCLSGTVAVLSHEIDWLVTPALRVSPSEDRADWSTMVRAVREQYPEVKIRYAYAPQGSRFAAEVIVESPEGNRERVYVDPYRGSVTGRTPWFNTQRFFRDFHRRFFIYAWWGIWVVGSFAFVLLGAAVTGLAFYKRWWTKWLVFRPQLGLRVLIADLHRGFGIWTLLFAIVIGVTGVWYMLELPLYYARKDQQPAPPRVPQTTLSQNVQPTDRLDVGVWLRAAHNAIPGFRVRSIWFPDTLDAPVRINGQATAWLVRPRANHVLLDPFTGEVLFDQKAEEIDLLNRWAHTADPLHFGNFGGLVTKLIWFAFGLTLSLLVPSGAILWVRRRTQMAAGAERRALRNANDDKTVQRLVRKTTRRNIAPGVLVTSATWSLAIHATTSAFTEQLVDSNARFGWQALGNVQAIVIYAAFLALILASTAIWVRFVWLPPTPTTEPKVR